MKPSSLKILMTSFPQNENPLNTMSRAKIDPFHIRLLNGKQSTVKNHQMAACIPVNIWLILLLVKKIFIVKNATAYTWDWYCHLVVDRASFGSQEPSLHLQTWVCVCTIHFFHIRKFAYLKVESLAQTTFRLSPISFYAPH